jgi:hypothetical protein
MAHKSQSPHEQERDGSPCTGRQQKQIQHNHSLQGHALKTTHRSVTSQFMSRSKTGDIGTLGTRGRVQVIPGRCRYWMQSGLAPSAEGGEVGPVPADRLEARPPVRLGRLQPQLRHRCGPPGLNHSAAIQRSVTRSCDIERAPTRWPSTSRMVAAQRCRLVSCGMVHLVLFTSTCPHCKRARPQEGFTFSELQRLLNGGHPIEGYCVACDRVWPISFEERIREP